jgi:hypothetical protein
MFLKALGKKWFHSFTINKDGTKAIEWQGQILVVGENYIIVELYEWVGGFPNVLKVVPISQITTWNIYETDKEMKEAYKSFK